MGYDETEVKIKFTAQNESGLIQNEKKLWGMVVINAIQDASKPINTKEYYKNRNLIRIKDRAIFWLFSDPSTEIGSLAWICNEVGLSIDQIRILAKREIDGVDTGLKDARSYGYTKKQNPQSVANTRKAW